MAGVFRKFFKIIILLGFLPVIIVVCVIFYYTHISKKNLINNYQKLADSYATLSYDNVYNFSKRLEYLEYMRALYRSDDVFLSKIFEKYDEVIFAAILDENGKEKKRKSIGNFSKIFKTIDISKKPYFEILRQKKEGVIGEFSVIGNFPVGVIVYPLKNNFVYLSLNLKNFFYNIYKTRIGESGFVFFVTGSGEALGEIGVDLKYSDIVKIKNTEYGSIKIDINSIDYIAVYRKVADFDLYVVVAQSAYEFYRDINLLFYSVLFLIFLVLTVSYFIAFVTTRNLSMPINALIEASKNVSEGIFDKYIEEKSDFEELDKLINVFNLMMRKLDEYKKIHIEELIDEREKLNSVLKNIKDIIILSDLSGNPIYMNDNAILKISSDFNNVRNLIHNFIKEIAFKKENIIKIGDNFFESNIEIIKLYRDKPMILIVLEDVTLEMKVYEMKEDFFRSIVHDIRTPILNIQGYIKLLSYSNDESIKKYIEGLKTESDTVYRMLENILDVSRIENRSIKVERREINLKELLKSIADRFEVRARIKNLYFNLDLGDDKPLIISADEELLRRAIENILTNAFKYTDKGGVTLKLEVNEKISIIISDTGRGIEKEKLKNIFDKFKNASKEGFGLGLSIAKAMIELNGAKIFVESEEGKGTKFTIIF
jgi:two-component system sensor histidine kinase VicK